MRLGESTWGRSCDLFCGCGQHAVVHIEHVWAPFFWGFRRKGGCLLTPIWILVIVALQVRDEHVELKDAALAEGDFAHVVVHHSMVLLCQSHTWATRLEARMWFVASLRRRSSLICSSAFQYMFFVSWRATRYCGARTRRERKRMIASSGACLSFA
jgi:hypothetical protein